MEKFYEWFDTAPLWVIGLATFIISVTITLILCAYAWFIVRRGGKL